MSRGQRIGFIAVAAAIAVVAIVVIVVLLPSDEPGKSEPAQAPAEPQGTSAPASGEASPGGAAGKEEKKKPAADLTRIEVRGGSPVGGVKELDLTKGDDVRLEVSSDVAEEVHVHGYDLTEDVGPDKAARFDFAADLEGIYEVELEGSHTQIAELKVSP